MSRQCRQLPTKAQFPWRLMCFRKRVRGKAKASSRTQQQQQPGKGKDKDGKPQKGKGQGKQQKGIGCAQQQQQPGKGNRASVVCHNCGKKGHSANECWNPCVQQVQSQSQGSDAASTVGGASTVSPSASQVAPSTASTQKRVARVEIDIRGQMNRGQRTPNIGDPVPVPTLAPVICRLQNRWYQQRLQPSRLIKPRPRRRSSPRL